MDRSIELRVREGNEDTLIYVFKTVADAAEMIQFLNGFFPKASFIVQPVCH
jgi:hypothetical protein